jgi:hypothetical protein
MINNLKATVCSFDYLRAIPFNLDTPQHFSLVYHNALPEKKATFLAKLAGAGLGRVRAVSGGFLFNIQIWYPL